MKKFLPYILILIVLVGLFGLAEKTNAQPAGYCWNKLSERVIPDKDEAGCIALNASREPIIIEWKLGTAPGAETDPCYAFLPINSPDYQKCRADLVAANTTTTPTAAEKSFAAEVEKRACVNFTNVDLGGCILKASNLIFVTLPAYILRQMAYFFNVLISVTLSSDLLKDTFVSNAWGVVRDLSNIFFILILLYIAVKIILDMGGHEAKKMIAKVLIIALLINFSMFFTQIIIDSSNILALIFYNKVSVNTTVAGQTEPRPYASVGGEKDVAGGMVNAFNPTRMLSQDFFTQARNVYEDGNVVTKDEVPTGTMLAIVLLSGAIMCIAIYALLVSGLSFLGRLIELWVLIIFSPFAFMSFTVPQLAGFEYLGWNAWFKRLLTVSFMAPIFMFFLYFIFMLISSNLFSKLIQPSVGANDEAGTIKTILGIVMPAIFICILLVQATKFAQKGSGALGGAIMTGAKMVGGVALGVATGGAAVLGRATIGRAGAAVANSGLARSWEAHGWGGESFRKATTALGAGSFDVRGVKIAGKTLAGATGMKLGEAQKGGFVERRKIYEENRQKRAKDLAVGEDEKLKQESNAVEGTHQELLVRDGNAHEIEQLDKRIKTLGDRSSVASRDSKLASSRGPNGEEGGAINSATGNTFKVDAELAKSALSDAQGERLAIKNASMFRKSDGTIVDHRSNTVDGNLSEDAIKGITDTARAAIYASEDAQTNPKAKPEDIEKAKNAEIIAVAARDAAYAARDVDLITKRNAAVAAAKAKPGDATLAAIAAEATKKASGLDPTATAAIAEASAKAVKDLAAANPTDDKLAKASQNAADALDKIANGLSGRSINNLEDTDIPAAHHEVERETKRRQRIYADTTERGGVMRYVFSGGQYSQKGATAAAHKIRMDAKLDSGSGGKGEGH